MDVGHHVSNGGYSPDFFGLCRFGDALLYSLQVLGLDLLLNLFLDLDLHLLVMDLLVVFLLDLLLHLHLVLHLLQHLGLLS